MKRILLLALALAGCIDMPDDCAQECMASGWHDGDKRLGQCVCVADDEDAGNEPR